MQRQLGTSVPFRSGGARSVQFVYLRNLLFYQRASANSRTGTGGNLEDPVMVPRTTATRIKNYACGTAWLFGKQLRVQDREWSMVGAIGFEPMTSTV
jgi:hypothetical protein